jgi:hypothetical protein
MNVQTVAGALLALGLAFMPTHLQAVTPWHRKITVADSRARSSD